MDEIRIRRWQTADMQDLRAIFTAAFGDSPEEAEAVHRFFLNTPESCTVAAAQEAGRPAGRPVAAAYCLPGPGLCFSERRVSSVYFYAFGCLPEWRGRGIMRQVYTSLFEAAPGLAPISCIIPVSDGLLQAYNRTGYSFVPLGRTRFARFTGAEARAAAALPAERLTWQTYARMREERLKEYPHAAYPDDWYRLAEAYRYSFLSLPGALAAVIPQEGQQVIAELLCFGADPFRALAGIAGTCPAEAYEVRTPASLPGPGSIRPFAYCHGTAGTPEETEAFWYPFGLE